jgi:hypothetical protein
MAAEKIDAADRRPTRRGVVDDWLVMVISPQHGVTPASRMG